MKKLSDLINYISRDQHIIEFRNQVFNNSLLSIFLGDTLKPLKIVEPSRYRTPLIYLDEEKNESWQGIFSKAEKAYKDENFNVALEYYMQCIRNNAFSLDANLGLANLYADLKDYENSVTYFKVALQISPEDPFVYHEYIKALTEAGKYETAIKLLEHLNDKYPLLDHRDLLLNINYHMQT